MLAVNMCGVWCVVCVTNRTVLRLEKNWLFQLIKWKSHSQFTGLVKVHKFLGWFCPFRLIYFILNQMESLERVERKPDFSCLFCILFIYLAFLGIKPILGQCITAELHPQFYLLR